MVLGIPAYGTTATVRYAKLGFELDVATQIELVVHGIAAVEMGLPEQSTVAYVVSMNEVVVLVTAPMYLSAFPSLRCEHVFNCMYW